MDGEIIEIRENELCKCRSFWDMSEDLTSDRLYGFVKRNIRRAFVFKTEDGYIGGCALFVREDGNGHLSHFNVAPEYRCQGIGSRLIDFAEQYFRSREVAVFGLNVMKNNADAIRLYERKGFKYAFDKTPEKIYMTKQLTVKPRVDYNTELIQTVIYLADVKDKTHQNIGNRYYCGEIDRRFEEYKNHAAVTVTRELIRNRNFNFIRPHRAAVRFIDLLNGKDELTDWAKLIRQFENDTDYRSFFTSLSGYFDRILADVRSCPLNDWKEYIEKYFRSRADLCLTVSPLDGNYGFIVGRVAYVVRCAPYYDGNKEIPLLESVLAKGIAHEYAHCFVNPIVESNKSLIENHSAFFNKHINMPGFYNVDYAVINEYWVRAFAIRFMEHMGFRDFDVDGEYKRQRQTFIFIDEFVDALKTYENSDDSFEKFYLTNISGLLNSIGRN
ncbi:MAG: GNAT family N-acetyltransferase [Oscillospiraceae bacterium]|nr:GNAT family N-acetyltransferase [Clostridia bacterium]MBP0990614.1 GNAT family N-acetyltransferase [Oscillospiraceae bacterium]